MTCALICGIFGCLCFGIGDWLMIYGNPAHSGNLIFLTEGTSMIPQWRYSFAMLLAYPGIILYGIALFAVQNFIREEKEKKIYHYLNVFGLTPWLALHLFYIMLLSLFSYLSSNGYANQALIISEGLFSQLSWIVYASQLMMLPVFIYWFYLQIRGKTFFPKPFAFTNVLVIFSIMKLIQNSMPVSAFRLGFTNGMMSESMIIWFMILLIFIYTNKNNTQSFG